MAIVCSLSGVVPEEPVLAKSSGHIYEKRLIEKHIEAHNTCPMTQNPMSTEDLVDVKTNAALKPRPATASSIPGLLSLFQNEWDAMMTETFQLKMQLETTRQQLAHALYQHDAACRVVARLIKERDAALKQVAPLQHQLALAKTGGDEQMVMAEGITPEMVQRIVEKSKTLAKGRKGRSMAGLTAVADLAKFSNTESHPVHQSTAPGILCLDIHPSNGQIVTGGVDQQVVLFDAEKKKLAHKMVGHQKKVLSVKFAPQKDAIISGSADGTARVWKGGKCVSVVKTHKSDVNHIALHPLQDFFVTCGNDNSWAFNDINMGRTIKHKTDLPDIYTCMEFQPDGLLLCGGTADKMINIWDIKEQVPVAQLPGHTDGITALTFSENGYYLASASKDNTVKLWDLRKPINFHTINVGELVNHVKFDHSGQFLAVCTSKLDVYNFEGKTNLVETASFTDHQAAVTQAHFGANASYIASTSMDRTVKIWA